MRSIDEKQIEQLLTELVDLGVLAVSAQRRFAQNGQISLTIYSGESEVKQAVKDHLATVDVVSIEEQLALLRYEQTSYGLDFLGDIPLFVDEDLQYRDPAGERQKGCRVERGVEELQSTFEPRTEDELEEELLPSDFGEMIQSTCSTVSNQVDFSDTTDHKQVQGIRIEETEIEEVNAEVEVLELISSESDVLEPYDSPVEDLYSVESQTDQGSLSAIIYATDNPERDFERIEKEVEQMACERRELLDEPTQPNDLARAIALQGRLKELAEEIKLKRLLIKQSNPVLEEDDATVVASLV